jgi:hypothetical protein
MPGIELENAAVTKARRQNKTEESILCIERRKVIRLPQLVTRTPCKTNGSNVRI